MFDPADFLQLAIVLPQAVLSRVTEELLLEAYVRTALGRAYYGLYLVVRSTLADRYGISPRRLGHGAVYTHLQHSRLSEDVRDVGRHLEYLYTLRRRADYELALDRAWAEKLRSPASVLALAIETLRLSRKVNHLDFSPIVHLF